MIRIGVVGFGRHLERSLLPNLVALDGAAIAAVADPDPARREIASARLPGVVLVPGPEALYAMPDVDALVVAAHPEAHVRITADALEAGKHVFVEKPLGAESAAVERLIELSRERDLVGMTGTMWRHTPANAVLRGWMAERRTQPTLVTVSATFPAVMARSDWSTSVVQTAFLDMFIHPVDWALHQVGEIADVDAVFAPPVAEGQVSISIRLVAVSGAIASLNLTTDSRAYQVAAWLSLADGSLVELHDNERLTITSSPTWSGTPGWIRDRPTLNWESGQLYRGWSRKGYREEFDEFIGRIVERRNQPDGLIEAAATLRVIERCLVSLGI